LPEILTDLIYYQNQRHALISTTGLLHKEDALAPKFI